MKANHFTTIITFLLLVPLWLGAQGSAPSLSRWTAGLSLGMPTKVYTSFGREDGGQDRDGNISPMEARVAYRIARWLEVGAHFAAGALQTSRTQVFRNHNSGNGPFPGLVESRGGWQALYISPRILLRHRQGDLFFEVSAGLYHLNLRQELGLAGYPSFNLQYQSNWSGWMGIRSGYTYWPSNRIGIELAYSWFDETGGLGAPNFELKNTWPANAPVRGNEVEAVENVVSLQALWLGVTYRL